MILVPSATCSAVVLAMIVWMKGPATAPLCCKSCFVCGLTHVRPKHALSSCACCTVTVYSRLKNYCVCVCVRARARVWLWAWCARNMIIFWGFYVSIFVDLVKHGVLTLVGDVDFCLSVVELTITVLSWYDLHGWLSISCHVTNYCSLVE